MATVEKAHFYPDPLDPGNTTIHKQVNRREGSLLPRSSGPWKHYYNTWSFSFNFINKQVNSREGFLPTCNEMKWKRSARFPGNPNLGKVSRPYPLLAEPWRVRMSGSRTNPAKHKNVCPCRHGMDRKQQGLGLPYPDKAASNTRTG